jgi:hypothetical protein
MDQKRALHGYRNEVSWDEGAGYQPYTNQDVELPPGAAMEFEGGNAGETAGRNVEQLAAVKGKPEPPLAPERPECEGCPNRAKRFE